MHKAREHHAATTLHCCSKNPDLCYIFEYLQQILVTIHNFRYTQRVSNVHVCNLRVGMKRGNNNNNPICKAPECQKTSVALELEVQT